MPRGTTEKQRTNITLSTEALTAAQVTTAETWARENVEAIAERRAWIKVNGTPLVDLQVLKVD